MSDAPVLPPANPDGASNKAAETPSDTTVEYLPTQAIEKLPKETKDLLMVFAAFFRSTTGPDPETAKAIAETEMHQETCRLEGFKESLHTKDKQGERDHDFRKKRLNHETARNMIIAAVAVGGIILGAYLLVAKNNPTVGTPLLIAGFMALVGDKNFLSKGKD